MVYMSSSKGQVLKYYFSIGLSVVVFGKMKKVVIQDLTLYPPFSYQLIIGSVLTKAYHLPQLHQVLSSSDKLQKRTD